MSPHLSRKIKSFKRKPVIIGCFFVLAISLIMSVFALVTWQERQAERASAGTFVFDTQEVDNTSTIMGRESSIAAIDSDNIYISYNDITNENLRFAKTDDGGDTWTYSNIDTDNAANELDMDALDANNIFVLYTGGDPFNTFDLRLAISSNGGDTWSTSTIFASEDVRNPQIDVLDVNTISIVWWEDTALFDRRFALSTNGGGSFTEVDPFVAGNGGTIGGPFIADSNNMYVLTRDGSTDYYCSKSSNGGSSFTSTLIETTSGTSIGEGAIVGVDANTLYFAYDRPVRIAKTTNGCTSFTYSSPSVSDGGTAFYYDGDIIDANNVFFSGSNLATDDLSLIYTNDGGTTWNEVIVDTGSDFGTRNSISAINANEVFFSYHDQTNGALRFASGVFNLQVLAQSPANNAVGVARDSAISFTFDESLNTGTVTTSSFVVRGQKSGLIPGSIGFSTTTLANDTATFTPSTDYLPGEEITVTLTPSIQSTDSVSIANGKSYSFFAKSEVGSGSFSSNQTLTSAQTNSTFLWKSCSGDFDNDGDVDLGYGATGNKVAFFINDGSGNFTASSYATGPTTFYIICVDVNNDQNVDLVHTETSRIGVAISNGDGTFQAPVYYNNSVGNSVALFGDDFNNDGYIDVVVSSQQFGDSDIGIYINNGDGTFQTGVTYALGAGESFRSVGAGDFDNDGEVEIVAPTEEAFSAPDVRVNDNNGDGTFTDLVSTISVSPATDARYVMMGDVTGDGNVDIIPIHGSQDFSVVTFTPDTLTLATETQYPLFQGGTCNEGSLIDIDGDADLDVMATCQSFGVSIAENDGAGVYTLLTEVPHSTTSGFQAVTSADLNGDGIIDVVGGSGDGEIEVFLQSAPFSVSSVTPSQNAIDIARDANVVLVFNESLNTGTVNQTNLPVFGKEGRIAGNYSFSTTTLSNDTVTFNPTSDFFAADEIEVVVTNNVQSFAATPSVEFVSNFTVETVSGLGQFTAGVSYTTADEPFAPCTADFNGDNNLDIATSNFVGNNVSYFENNGDGTYATKVDVMSGSGNYVGILCKDFNLDGDMDIAVSRFNGGGIGVSFGNGDGTFGGVATYGSASSPYFLESGDFDGDGDIDIITPRQSGTQVTVYLNNGSGVFDSGTNYTNGIATRDLAVADYDNDGILDVAAVSESGQTPPLVRVQLGDGSGGFGSFVDSIPLTGESDAESIEAGDLNNDGDPDLVALRGNRLLILIGDGDGTFQTPVLYTFPCNALAARISDIDSDNDLDVVGSCSTGLFGTAFNNGSGVFSSGVSLTTNTSDADHLEIGDLNNDGIIDVVTTGFDETISVLIGIAGFQTTALSPARNALDVAANSNITITMEDSLNPATVIQGNIPVFGSGALLPGAYSVTTTTISNDTIVFNPTNDFELGETIEVVLTDSVVSTGAIAATPQNYTFVVEATNGLGSFDTATVLSTNDGNTRTPAEIEPGDLNNDGHIDIAYGFSSAGTAGLGVRLNNGDGTFASQVIYSSSLNSQRIEITDLDNDGFNDIILSSQNSNVMDVFINNGDGTFAGVVTYPGRIEDFETVDIDMDGDKDFVASAASNDYVGVFLNNGDGTFAASVDYIVNNPNGMAVGDFDNDGDPDVFVGAINSANSYYYFANNGDGTLATPTTVALTGNISWLLEGDFNNDGNLDIVGTNGSTNVMFFLAGDGDGTFQSPVTYATANSPRGLDAGDFDADGDLDVIVTNSTLGNSFRLFVNNGSGVFDAGTDFSTTQSSTVTLDVKSADFNGDGALDAITTNTNAQSLSLFFGEVPFAVSSVTPSQNDIDIAAGSNITFVFNDSLNIGTVNQANVPVFSAERGLLNGSYSFSTTNVANDTVIFDPTEDFRTGEQIIASVTSSVQSTGALSATPFSTSFNAASLGGNFVTSALPSVPIAGDTSEKVFHADLNGDNFIDIVAISFTTTYILTNDGSGALTLLGSIPIGSDQITGGDYNGDGTVDLAISNNSGNRIDIYSNNGSAIFASLSNVAVGQRPYGATTNDFDGDGDLDIIVGDLTDDNAKVLLNNGSGTFTNTQTINAGYELWGATSGDFDGDGDMDAALASDGSSNILLLINDGTGTFASSNIGTSFTTQNISSGDIDGDGDIDLFSGGTPGGQFQINDGDGGFTNGATITAGTGWHRDHMFGDIDADGDLDLVVSRLVSEGISYFSNDGAGVFTLEQTVTTGVTTPDGVILADMDNDGDLDAAYVSRNLETANVLLNQGITEGGGGGTFTQLTQQSEQGSNIPVTPTPLQGEALDSTSIQWEFNDNSGVETGFQLIDGEGNVLAELTIPNQVSITETGLEPNTLYADRRLVATGTSTDSEASDPFDPVATLAPEVNAILQSADTNSVTATIDNPFPNLTEGQSALLFELVTIDTVSGTAVFTSDWIQEDSYTFEGLDPGLEYQLRVNARNQDGIENGFTPLSDPAVVPEQDQVLFDIALGATYVGGDILEEILDPKRNIRVNISIRNTGNIPATNVLANIPVPQYMSYIPGSLFVDSDFQSSDADQDLGQGNQNAVSVIWQEMGPGESAIVSFDLGFDLDALRTLRDRERANAEAINELAGLGEVLVAANPQLVLEASVNSSETPDAVATSAVILQPDLEQVPDQEVEVPEEESSMEFMQEQQKQGQVSPPPGGGNTQAPNNQQETSDEAIETEDETEGELILTTEANPSEDNLVFMGTTSQPNTKVIVTLLSQSFEVVSDENGIWELFVTAEQLGIEPGQSRNLEVESIAVKGEKSSNVVRQNLSLTRAQEGEIIVERTTSVQSAQIVRSLTNAAVFVQEQEEEVQAALAVAAPVIVIASAPLLGYLPFIPTMIIHGLASILGIAGRKKKDRRFYGIVYDSVSKEPLSLAIVRIYNKRTNKLVATQVTDKQGRYDLLLKQGSYRIEVTRPGFSFPTSIISGKTDGMYQDIYQVQEPIVIGDQVIAPPDIPLDPIHYKREWNVASVLKKFGILFQKWMRWLIAPVLFVGVIISLLLLLGDPSSIVNWIYVFLYTLLLLLQLRLRPSIEKAWGVVYDLVTGAVLPLTTVQLVDAEYGKVVKSRLSDYEGRYSFLTHPGTFVVKANKPGFEQAGDDAPQDAYHHPIPSKVKITKENEHLTGDIAMQPKE